MPKQDKTQEQAIRRQRQDIQRQLEAIEDQISEATEGQDVSSLQAEYDRLRQERSDLHDREHQAIKTRIDAKKAKRRGGVPDDDDGA